MERLSGWPGGCLMMKAYEFYWDDEKEVSHLIGILPERRKNPKRVTKKYIMNWVRNILGDNGDFSHQLERENKKEGKRDEKA
jgi:hypothetical protein